MTIPRDCITRVAELLGDKASQRQLFDVGEDIARLQRSAIREGISPAQSLDEAVKRYAREAQLAALIEKRNAALNVLRYQERSAYLKQTWKGAEAEGLRALLTGSIRGRKGARASVANEQRVLTGLYVGQLTTELERAGVLEVWKTGALDRDVSRALWQLNSKAPDFSGLAGDAVKIARAVHRLQEVARADANAAGGWIGKLEGWIVRQSHDAWKLGKSGLEGWRDYLLPRLDWSRIEAEHGEIRDKMAWLGEVFTGLQSGIHMKADGAVKMTGFKGPGNLAKKMSAERVLHFKDADAWFDYNARFGAGNLREAVFGGLRSSARNTGLMRVLGPNPEAMFNRLVDSATVSARSDGKRASELAKAAQPGGWLHNRLAEVQGTANIPVSQTIARIGGIVRAHQSMTKLGGAMISSVQDLATYASEMSYQGQGFLSGIGEAIGAVGRGRPSHEQAEILSGLGVFFDSMIGDVTRQGSLDDTVGGGTSRLLQTFFKYNLLNWWTDSLRSSAALSMSHTLALNATRGFDALSPELKRTFGLFGIEAGDWDHMRTNGVKYAADGRVYLVADNLDAKRSGQLRGYVVDRAHSAVIEPDADTRAMLKGNGRSGTIDGEIRRSVVQFKGFPVAFARQVIGREIYGRGAEAFGQGSIAGIAQLVVASTILGYAAMSVKDLLKGKTPRDPSNWQTITSAMVQGGGAGIYGDFLFGEFNRFGRSPVETLAGPTLGTAADILSVWAKLIRGQADGGDALRLAFNNTPFLNLFYTRVALDYLILYQVQEWVSPGTLRRMERRTERDTGQKYLMRPSDTAR